MDHKGAVHHVFGRGNRKHELFRDDEDRRLFLKRLAALKTECGFALYAFCLMGNHYHLALAVAEVLLQKIMQRLLTSYARLFNDRWDLVGHPFQGRYGNRVIVGDNDLRGVIRYIHRNPVEAGLVSHPGEWAWSSYQAVAGREAGLVDSDLALSLFDGDYESFMSQASPEAERLDLEAIATSFGGCHLLKGSSRHAEALELRRSFLAEALTHGYKQREIARFLGRTEAAVSRLLARM